MYFAVIFELRRADFPTLNAWKFSQIIFLETSLFIMIKSYLKCFLNNTSYLQASVRFLSSQVKKVYFNIGKKFSVALFPLKWLDVLKNDDGTFNLLEIAPRNISAQASFSVISASFFAATSSKAGIVNSVLCNLYWVSFFFWVGNDCLVHRSLYASLTILFWGKEIILLFVTLLGFPFLLELFPNSYSKSFCGACLYSSGSVLTHVRLSFTGAKIILSFSVIIREVILKEWQVVVWITFKITYLGQHYLQCTQAM